MDMGLNLVHLFIGLSKHKPDQDMHGDWTYSYSPQLGKSLREFVRCPQPVLHFPC